MRLKSRFKSMRYENNEVPAEPAGTSFGPSRLPALVGLPAQESRDIKLIVVA